MFVIVHCVHNNAVPHIATPCCLFWCDFQPWLTMLFPAWLACTFRALGNIFWSLSSWRQLHPFEVHAEWEGD